MQKFSSHKGKIFEASPDIAGALPSRCAHAAQASNFAACTHLARAPTNQPMSAKLLFKVCYNKVMDKRGKNLGIIGGTFDPVHLGHIGCAKAAADVFQLAEV